MGTEAAKVVLDRLLIANFDKYFTEEAHLGIAGRGYMASGLDKKTQNSDGLQGDSFAARIGAGDDDRTDRFSELQRQWHYLTPLMPLQKDRMIGLDEPHHSSHLNPRLHTQNFDRILRLGVNEIEFAQSPGIQAEKFPCCPDLIG